MGYPPSQGNGSTGVAGNVVKEAVLFSSAASLPAYTRTGNVILANANGAWAGHASADGITPVVGDRFLLKNGASGADNGIYVVDAIGAVGSKWQLTRATDADTSDKFSPDMLVPVQSGTVNADLIYQLYTNGAITLNTTSLTFSLPVATPAAHATSHISGGSDPFTSSQLLEAIVKRLQTSTGPTTLTLGAIADGQYLKRNGTDIDSAAITSNPRSSTFTVASSGGDYTTIQAALDALPAAGGSVYFVGTMSITTTITMPNKPVHLYGDGKSSIIDLGSNGIQAITHSNDVRHSFANFHIKGDATAGQGGFYSTVADTVTAGSGLFVQNVSSYQIATWMKDNSVSTYMTSIGCSCGLTNAGYYVNGLGNYIFDSCIGWGASSGSSCGGVTGASNPGPYIVLMSNCYMAWGKASIVGHCRFVNCSFDSDGGGFTQDPASAGYVGQMTGCNLTASGATAWTWNGPGTEISGNHFRGTNTVTLAGANPLFSSNTSFSSGGVIVVVSGANGKIASNHLRDAAGTTRCIDVTAGGTGITVIGNECLNSSAEDIKTASTGGTYAGNVFSHAVGIREVTGAATNTFIGMGLSGMVLLAGSASTVNGVTYSGGTGTSTNALVVKAGTFTQQNGFAAIVGTLKNTDGANSLDYKISVTDLFGTSDTVTATLTFGQNAGFTDDGYITGAGTRTLGIGTARAPFKTWKLEVIDTVLNTHATYGWQISIQGQ